jgi:hypothetical protein
VTWNTCRPSRSLHVGTRTCSLELRERSAMKMTNMRADCTWDQLAAVFIDELDGVSPWVKSGTKRTSVLLRQLTQHLKSPGVEHHHDNCRSRSSPRMLRHDGEARRSSGVQFWRARRNTGNARHPSHSIIDGCRKSRASPLAYEPTSVHTLTSGKHQGVRIMLVVRQRSDNARDIFAGHRVPSVSKIQKGYVCERMCSGDLLFANCFTWQQL